MSAVVTASSTVTCGHITPVLPGTVSTVGSPKLTVGGSPVLIASGIEGKAVTSCGITPSSTSTKCLTVKSVSVAPASVATKLTVGGKPVVLAGLQGTTDGKLLGVTPQPLLGATVAQTLLTAT
jgi:hypothetical protein